MSKKEFIDSLRRNLLSIKDYTFVNDTISYYENYIDSQIRMGKTENEVMAQLGDPRLIAKTICATRMEGEYKETDAYQEYEQGLYSRGKDKGSTTLGFNGKLLKMPSWVAKIIGILLVFLVFFVVLTVLKWLAPFILVGVCTYFIYKTFFGKY